MNTLRIEYKIIISIVFFTLLLTGMERYWQSKNVIDQFIAAKKEKNTLLLNTISPILGLNISLGLKDANKEYLDDIAKQNADLLSIELSDLKGNKIYSYYKYSKNQVKKHCCEIDSLAQIVVDPITGDRLGMINANFDDHEYQLMLEKNKKTSLVVFAITLVLLAGFIFFLKREFRFLKELTKNVIEYDPQMNNFPMNQSTRTDEVGVIHNAILGMVEKIHSHTKLLDIITRSLEVKVKERTQELEEANRQLRELTLTDPLTQLSNRRAFESHFLDICQLAKRNHKEISVVMCDIDHFKNINDTYGHKAGDDILKEMAAIMKSSLKRSSDFIARYGGEEFIIVLYDTSINDAHDVCNGIQENIKSLNGFESQWGKIDTVTMSFGIASFIPDESANFDTVITSADVALYRAKNEGRNRIITA